ncbi:hypothetical protein HBJ58_18590 [Halomonas desiderata]|uniref:hypothetical protein n=1 Tax=Billgrantia desiderata TaxID=52021 RepID=UPI00174BA85B|nr:hypothetical protein [Halomonas desiderata]
MASVAQRRISVRRLLGYLDKVERGEPLRLDLLQCGLAQFGLPTDELLKQCPPQFVKRKEYRFVGADSALLARWREALAPGERRGRAHAAFLGNSHSSRVSSAMVVVRRLSHRHPLVALCDGKLIEFQTSFGEQALIVENLENFLALDETLSLLPLCGLDNSWRKADILFGSGNGITNELLQPLLRQYLEIGCLFDPDFGGLRMFDTLYQRDDMPPLRWLAPADLEQRLLASKRNLPPEQRQQLNIFATRTPPLRPVAQLLYDTGKRLEQETYLDLAAPRPEDTA